MILAGRGKLWYDILADKELLADILTVGINNTLEQVKKDKNSKLGKYTNGLGGLF